MYFLSLGGKIIWVFIEKLDYSNLSSRKESKRLLLHWKMLIFLYSLVKLFEI